MILSESKVTILAKLWDAIAKFQKQYFIKCLEWWRDHWTHCTKSQRDGFAKRTTLIRSICYHYEEITSQKIIWSHHAHPKQVYSIFYTHLYAAISHLLTIFQKMMGCSSTNRGWVRQLSPSLWRMFSNSFRSTRGLR